MANITLNEYQQKAMTTCLPESDNLFYMLANLCGEVGEFASKAGKHMRKGKLHILGKAPKPQSAPRNSWRW